MKTAEIQDIISKIYHNHLTVKTGTELILKVMKGYAEQREDVLRKQLRENSEREERLLKQIELKQFYTKDQVEQYREEAFKSAWEYGMLNEELRDKKFEEYKNQNPLK